MHQICVQLHLERYCPPTRSIKQSNMHLFNIFWPNAIGAPRRWKIVWHMPLTSGVRTGGPVWCESLGRKQSRDKRCCPSSLPFAKRNGQKPTETEFWCSFSLRSAPPPIGGNFYNCWTGDPHFVCSCSTEWAQRDGPTDSSWVFIGFIGSFGHNFVCPFCWFQCSTFSQSLFKDLKRYHGLALEDILGQCWVHVSCKATCIKNDKLAANWGHGRRSDPLVPGTHWVLKQQPAGMAVSLLVSSRIDHLINHLIFMHQLLISMRYIYIYICIY